MKLPIRSTFSEKEWVKITPELRQFLNHRGERYLDFSVVEWADPIPLLSLCLMLRKDCIFNQHTESFKKVKLVIDLRTKLYGHKRLLLFLRSQGFLRELIKYASLVDRDKQFIKLSEIDKKISDFNVPPMYQNANCIKVKIKGLEELSPGVGLDKFIDELMEEALEETSVTVEPSWSLYKDYALHKLRHFCSELVENILEHAYCPPADNRWAFAVYARIRSGKSFVEWQGNECEWDKQIEFERNNCYLLDIWDEYAQNHDSKWIEVFIVDIGRGLLHQVNEWHSENEKANEQLQKALSRKNRLLRAIYHIIFVSGFSSSPREATKTKMTGLQLVHETLKQKESQGNAASEFFRLLTGHEIVGGHPPFPKAQGEGGHYGDAKMPLLLGTAFHACIEISNSLITHPEAYKPASKDQISSIMSSLNKDVSVGGPDIFISDQRYIGKPGQQGDIHKRPTDLLNPRSAKGENNGSTEKYSRDKFNKLIKDSNYRHLIWLPPSSIRKSDIKDWIDFCLFSHLESFIVADITLHITRTLDYIVSNDEFYVAGNIKNKGLRIYIITRDWFIASYKSELHNNNTSREKYCFTENSHPKLNNLGLEKLNQMLRQSDSAIFWYNVLRYGNNSFVAEPIEWDCKGKTTSSFSGVNKSGVNEIQGYLDFNEAMSEPANYKIVRAALERAIALWREYRLIVISIDDLVKTFTGGVITIQDFNDISYDDLQSTQKILLIGSTYVTGDTGGRMRNLIEGNFPKEGISELYVFSHPSSSLDSGAVNTILNWSNDIKIKTVANDRKYVRLEGTPYVKRGGVKSFSIERNKFSAYNMYREFAQGHLKLGHWEYSKSHDLLTPNLSRVIATNPAITKWFCDKLLEFENEHKGDKKYLIYISHKVTDKLIDRIIKFKPKIQELYEIHPLHKLNSTSAQRVFFSPIALEKIEAAAANEKTTLNIVLIDDAAVSGSTLRNAESSLIFNDRYNILTLLLIDRCGFSVEGNLKYSEKITREAYWAWDVPPLGASGHCLLCYSIDKIKALARNIPNQSIRLRAEHWIKIWKSRLVVDEGWDLNGVSTQLLSQPYTMRFGHPFCHITHINSTTLSSMSIEISNSSFQPSSPLNKFYRYSDKNGSLTPKVSLEILATQILLLGDGLTMPTKLDYYSAVVRLLWECDNADTYTALAGLTLGSVGNSLKQLVWYEMRELIHKNGFSSKYGKTLGDIELACLTVIADIPDIKNKLNKEIKESKSLEDTKSTESFNFLLSLVQNREDQRKPIFDYYRMFGSGPDESHRGRLTENIFNAIKDGGIEEHKQRQKINKVIDEAVSIIHELDRFDFISGHDFDSAREKLEKIRSKLDFKISTGLSEFYLGNLLIDSNLLKLLWPYAQSSADSIANYIREEIRLFGDEFKDYYERKRAIKGIQVNWRSHAKGPDIVVRLGKSKTSTSRYLFFKPFRDFIRDTIYNSIWVCHGIKKDNGDSCSMIIKLEEGADNLTVIFANLLFKGDAVKLHSRAYQTRINALDGHFSVEEKVRKDRNSISKIKLVIPKLDKFFPKGV